MSLIPYPVSYDNWVVDYLTAQIGRELSEPRVFREPLIVMRGRVLFTPEDRVGGERVGDTIRIRVPDRFK